MNTTNALPSELAAVAAVVAPASLGVGVANSGWIDLSLYERLFAIISTGVLGTGATLDAKWQLADNVSGLNTVDSTQNALVQIVKAAGDNVQAVMNFDVNKSKPFTKRFARLAITVGGASSLASAVVLGFDPRHSPATDFDVATMVQVA